MCIFLVTFFRYGFFKNYHHKGPIFLVKYTQYITQYNYSYLESAIFSQNVCKNFRIK